MKLSTGVIIIAALLVLYYFYKQGTGSVSAALSSAINSTPSDDSGTVDSGSETDDYGDD